VLQAARVTPPILTLTLNPNPNLVSYNPYPTPKRSRADHEGRLKVAPVFFFFFFEKVSGGRKLNIFVHCTPLAPTNAEEEDGAIGKSASACSPS